MKTKINYDEVIPSVEGNRLVWPDGKWIPYARGGSTAETDPAQVQAAADAAAQAAAAGLTLDASTAAATPIAVQSANGRVVSGTPVFTQEELNARIEAARKEEKDKLYGKINETESKADEALRKLQEREAAEAKIKEEADRVERERVEAEMSAKELLAQQKAEFDAKLAALEAKQAQSEALLAKEREYAELQMYITNRKAQLADDENMPVLPELINEISGNTVEEVEANVARLAGITASIVGNVQQQIQMQQPIAPLQAVRQGVAGTVASAPPAGPMDQAPSYQNYTEEQLKAMSMEEYAKVRPQLMGAVSQQVNQRGVYG